jgi:hypothetical protein
MLREYCNTIEQGFQHLCKVKISNENQVNFNYKGKEPVSMALSIVLNPPNQEN